MEGSSITPDSIEGIFGSDESLSTFKPIKTETIVPHEIAAKDATPVIKLETFSVNELKQQLKDKKKIILSMNEEVLVIENIISQDMDPINTHSDQIMSQNLLSSDNQTFFGSSENPVTLSSDEENLEASLDVSTPSSTEPHCWETKNRHD